MENGKHKKNDATEAHKMLSAMPVNKRKKHREKIDVTKMEKIK